MKRTKVAGELVRLARRLITGASDFEAALEEFLEYWQFLSDQSYLRYENLTPAKLVPVTGPRYVKIMLDNGTSRSAAAFIDKATGDILKAASWSAPAKHARGNIYDRSTWRGMSAYGPQYLR